MAMLGIHRKRPGCSCWEGSAHWTWPLTRAHEKYNGQVVTSVRCKKHPWSVRLYDFENMRFVTIEEEEKFLLQIQVSTPQSQAANAHGDMTAMIAAGA
jgi:hypothetical protein